MAEALSSPQQIYQRLNNLFLDLIPMSVYHQKHCRPDWQLCVKVPRIC